MTYVICYVLIGHVGTTLAPLINRKVAVKVHEHRAAGYGIYRG
jgi:hypothetical protein